VRINQNIAAFNAYRNLSSTSGQQSKSLEKLSSGFRINRAGDDASGLVKSEGLRAEIGGTKQAIQNAQDGISFVQTAEGALNEVHAILQRIRELSISAANRATNDGVAEQAEVDQLVDELVSIGNRTKFSGLNVFENYDGINGGTTLTFHIGAGSGAINKLNIVEDLRIQESGTSGIFAGITLSEIGLTQAGSIDVSIGIVDSAIAAVSEARSILGATQNRMEHTISNLQVAQENLSASESRIRDADMALEMVSFTRHQIMVQAGTAMLAQANQSPQSVLSLLQG
jgi:flagellin